MINTKYYPRKIDTEVTKHLASKEIVVVTGMRRVGKTTLLKKIFLKIESENKAFFDMDNPLDQKIFEEEDYNNVWDNMKPRGITKKEKAFVLIDEIQANPAVVKIIKYLYDHYEVKFFLTGSSSFYLKHLFPESLAGRKVLLELFPLDFEEFLCFKESTKEFREKFAQKDKEKNKIAYEKVKKLYDEYLEFGGFPQVALEEKTEKKKEALMDIFKSYFEKDVQTLADFREMKAFRDMLLLLLKRAGAKLDISKIAAEIGVARDTVYSYLSFLEKTYFITLLSPFTQNIDKEVSGTKKVYLCDNGIARQIGNADEGNLLENAVFNNLRRYGEIKYYQKRSGPEIDFILAEKGVGLEVKNKGTDGDYRKLKRTARELKLKEFYVISKEFVNKKGFIMACDL